jgi:hypothetical protein
MKQRVAVPGQSRVRTGGQVEELGRGLGPGHRKARGVQQAKLDEHAGLVRDPGAPGCSLGNGGRAERPTTLTVMEETQSGNLGDATTAVDALAALQKPDRRSLFWIVGGTKA